MQSATVFAVNQDATLQEKYKSALAQFPGALPYEVEEQKTNQGYTDHLKEEATSWAGLGDRANYKQSQCDEDRIAITYELPDPLTPKQEARLAKSTTVLRGFSVVGWACQSLSANKLD